MLARWPEVVAAATPADAGKVQAWVVGPGTGHRGQSIALLRWVLSQDVPVLVDADGLTILAAMPSLLVRPSPVGAATVLTPHDREFARVFPDIDLDDRLAAVRRAAAGQRGDGAAQGPPDADRRAGRPGRGEPVGVVLAGHRRIR